MNTELQAKLWGLVRGHSAVVIVAIIAIVFVAFSGMPDWLKLVFLLVLAPLICAGAFRMVRGTEEGPTDLVVTADGIRITNIVPSRLGEVLGSALRAYRRPLPRPAGTVQGNPAKEADLVATTSAPLPEDVQVTDQSLEPTGDTGKLS